MCDETMRATRRSFLAGVAGATAPTALPWTHSSMAATAASRYADPKNPALPNPGMRLDLRRTALVVIDPQIDFMSPKGAGWSIVDESVTEQNLVPNLVRLFDAAKRVDITVALSRNGGRK
jgi:isochorismate hydrolase